jgi:hypothetical protein
VIAHLASQGLLTLDGDVVRLSPRAHLIANQVFLHFIPDG